MVIRFRNRYVCLLLLVQGDTIAGNSHLFLLDWQLYFSYRHFRIGIISFGSKKDIVTKMLPNQQRLRCQSWFAHHKPLTSNRCQDPFLTCCFCETTLNCRFFVRKQPPKNGGRRYRGRCRECHRGLCRVAGRYHGSSPTHWSFIILLAGCLYYSTRNCLSVGPLRFLLFNQLPQLSYGICLFGPTPLVKAGVIRAAQSRIVLPSSNCQYCEQQILGYATGPETFHVKQQYMLIFEYTSSLCNITQLG